MAGIDGLTAAVYEVADAIHSHGHAPGRRSHLRPPAALAWAMSLCRYQDEEGVWHGLAEHVKRVPVEFVDADTVVACTCGASVAVSRSLAECSCGRWFTADGSGVWCVRLPEAA